MIDIFSPQISALSYDLSGKTILIYGTNRTGKTKQLTKLSKPCYLAFEAGLNAIAGVPFFPMQKWSDFASFVKQITVAKNLERAKEMYQTIILDQAEAMGLLCDQFVCEKFEVASLGSRKTLPNGKQDFSFNGYKEYSKEVSRYLALLTSVGFTVAFIAHEGTRDFKDENGEEYSKIYPAGDKRIIDPICNLVDIIAYAAVNGIDENNNEIKSSLFMTNTRKYHAGSRFDYLPSYLKEFTASNLETAIAEAVRDQEKAEGIKAVDFATQSEAYKVKEKSYDEMKNEIRTIAENMFNNNEGDKYKAIVEEHLGKDRGVQDTDASQKQLLELILADLQLIN